MVSDSRKRSRRSIRLPEFDYSQTGSYFVTVVTHGREFLFGSVVDGEVCLNEFGQIVCDEWQRSSVIRREIELDAFVIMPNHIHGIVSIVQREGRATSRSPLHAGPTKSSIGSFVGGFKSAVTTRINSLRNSSGKPVWQRNYYEHVIRDEESLVRMRQYIVDNPLRWEFDPENPAAAKPDRNDVWNQ